MTSRLSFVSIIQVSGNYGHCCSCTEIKVKWNGKRARKQFVSDANCKVISSWCPYAFHMLHFMITINQNQILDN